MGFKLVLVVRKDLKMGVGKIAAQCSHASIHAYQNSKKTTLFWWALSGQKKIVVSCLSEEALYEVRDKANTLGVSTNLVRDAGHTQVDPGTITVMAVGPAKEELVDQITGDLKLL